MAWRDNESDTGSVGCGNAASGNVESGNVVSGSAESGDRGDRASPTAVAFDVLPYPERTAVKRVGGLRSHSTVMPARGGDGQPAHPVASPGRPSMERDRLPAD